MCLLFFPKILRFKISLLWLKHWNIFCVIKSIWNMNSRRTGIIKMSFILIHPQHLVNRRHLNICWMKFIWDLSRSSCWVSSILITQQYLSGGCQSGWTKALITQLYCINTLRFSSFFLHYMSKGQQGSSLHQSHLRIWNERFHLNICFYDHTGKKRKYGKLKTGS